MTFKRVCDVGEIDPGMGLKFDDPAGAVAIFNVDGEFCAIEDRCSHGEWSLAEGYLEGDVVECTLHMGQFCVRTGKPKKLPVTCAVKVFPVRIIGHAVEVDVDAGAFAT